MVGEWKERRSVDTADVTPAECHGVVYVTGVLEYTGSAFTAMRWQVVKDQANVTVIQAVTEMESATSASGFVTRQADSWRSCKAKLVTLKSKNSGGSSQRYIRDVTKLPDLVSASSGSVDQHRSCNHVLQAVSQFLLEVEACSGNASEEARDIALKMALRVTDQ